MIRSTYRRSPKLESLETRTLLSGPTAQQQYMLELLNLVRTNPPAAANRILSNLDSNTVATLNYYKINLPDVKNLIASSTPQPPLAWNAQLGTAAQAHSQDMANTGVQSHTGSDGSSPQTRMDNVGYTNRSTSGEDAYAYSTSPDEAMQAFLIDWGVASNGHRVNIIQPNVPSEQAYRDVGIGIVNSNRTGFGPEVTTVDFGSQQNQKPQLLGVAYNDPSHTHFYTPGQGRSGVTIEATNLANGRTSSTMTEDAGGYQMPLDPGTYRLTARQGGQVIRTQNVSMGAVNVKVDYDLSDPWQGNNSTPTPPPPAPTAPAPVRVNNVQPPAPTAPSGSFLNLSWITSWTSWTAGKAS